MSRVSGATRPGAVHRLASVFAALAASLLLLFLFAPLAELVVTGGGTGLRRLATDGELRSSLVLTAVTATAATVIGILGGTPLAYLLARRNFRGRALLEAVLDLPLLIPHPVAGIALLIYVLTMENAARTPEMYAGVIALAALGYLLNRVFLRIERARLRWYFR